MSWHLANASIVPLTGSDTDHEPEKGTSRASPLHCWQCAAARCLELAVSSLISFLSACSNFDFNKLRLKIGPAKKTFNLKPGQFGTKWVCLHGTAFSKGKLGGPLRLQELSILVCLLMHIYDRPMLRPPTSPGCRAEADKKAGPFFLFAYADEDIIVARGRGGGVAFWWVVLTKLGGASSCS